MGDLFEDEGEPGGGRKTEDSAARFVPPGADLDQLKAAAAGCTACPLHERGTQTVFGEGRAGATVMLVGEQPGDQEDLQGRPFVGPAGQLLDWALEKAGIDRERGLRHQRRQALQVGAARQAADPQQAVVPGDQGLRALARGRARRWSSPR